jgi:hypothetical protein
MISLRKYLASILDIIIGYWKFRWGQLRRIAEILGYTRFSVFVVAVMLLTLTLVPQGRELASRAGAQINDYWAYPLATFVLAVQVWFWARVILSRKFVRQSEREKIRSEPLPGVTIVDPDDPITSLRYWLVIRIPRWLAYIVCSVPIVFVAWIWWTNQSSSIKGLLAAQFGVLLAVVALANGRPWLSEKLTPKVFGVLADSAHEFRLLGPGIKGLSIVQAAGLALWAWYAPNDMGETLGSVPVLMLALASIVPIGSVIVLFTIRRNLPIVTPLVLTGLLLSSCDPHNVRTLDATDTARPKIEDAFQTWMKQLPASEGQTPKMFVVAASGGGITAAYWTAVVLSRLDEAVPNFRQRLFAISSVSGGSVGAAAFAQGLNCTSGQARESGELWGQVRPSLQGDLLAPVLSTMLFADLPFWYPPFSAFAKKKSSDRASTFEVQLERNWKNAFNAACPDLALDQSFLNQRSVDRWLPILLFNSTHQETGRPVVMSQASLPPARKADSVTTNADGDPFNAALDYFALTQSDLRISTAALNSARFPYVSPAGRMRFANSSLPAGHLVDGGYFNNDGATTLQELLEALQAQLKDVEVYVVQISIDPPSFAESTPGIGDRSAISELVAHASSSANEIMAPLRTMQAVRGGHGQAGRADLREWTEVDQNAGRQHYFHFRLMIPEPTKDRPDVVRPPLGWVLSPVTEKQMEERTLCLGENFKQWTALMTKVGIASNLVKCGEEIQEQAPGQSPPSVDSPPMLPSSDTQVTP